MKGYMNKRPQSGLPSLARQDWLNEPRLQKVLAVLNTGGETRVAGGAVRNALMKKQITDVDLATTFLPTDVMQLARGAGFGVHPTGLEHGTVTVVNRAATFEVTTLRHDIETDGRHAVVSFTKNFAEDAARRDFTMNALYCDRHGKIYDFIDGYKDIRRKKVRFVGKAAERIQEDYLRILRFFRFEACYGKGVPDRGGLLACKKLRKGLANISAERLRQEMFKLLVAPRATQVLKVMIATKVLGQILPCKSDWRLVKRLPKDGVLRLVAISSEPLGLKERLRLSNADASRIAAVVGAPEVSPKLRDSERRALLYQIGPQAWQDIVHMCWARSRAALSDAKWKRLVRLADGWERPVLPLTGRDLLSNGFHAGPEVGAALQQAEDYWIASDFTASHDELMALVKDENAQE